MKSVSIWERSFCYREFSALAQDPGDTGQRHHWLGRVDSGATFAFVPIYAVTDDSVMYL